jgi:putative ABC transport system permease protein
VIRRLFRLPPSRESVPRDVEAEIQFHIDSRSDELTAEGKTPEEARAIAAREFGDLEAARSELAAIDQRRENRQRRAGWWDVIRQDSRYAFRSIRRDTLFSTAIVLTLALGIGANATVFGVLDWLVLRAPAHVSQPETVAKLYITTVRGESPPQAQDAFSYPMYLALREGVQGVTGVSAVASRQLSSGRGSDAILVKARLITPNYFDLLGVKPALGRFFSEDEAIPPSGSAVVVLGWEFWRTRFGGESSVIGRTVPIGPLSYTVVGIAPKGLTAMDLGKVDVWLPISAAAADGQLTSWHTSPNSTWIRLFARLAPGTTFESVSASAAAVAARTASDSRLRWKAVDARALPIFGTRNFDGTRSGEGRVAVWLAAVSLVVLLIACANVANLLLARARRRHREIAVRIALGISRGRLAALFGIEGLLLALLGGFAALLLAYVGGGVIRQVLLSDVAWTSSPVDYRVFGVTAAIAVFTGCFIGLGPALLAINSSVAGTLKSGSREVSGRRSIGRTALLVLQPALSVFLLVGAGLFVRSLANVRALDIGMDPSRVLVATVDLQPTSYTQAEASALFERALDGVLRVPGVETAAIGATIPFDSDEGIFVVLPGRADSMLTLGSQVPSFNTVTAAFFETMGIRLVAGRLFTADEDRGGMPRVAVVNQTFARTAWPGRSPIGECIRTAGDPVCATVVGMVHDSRRSSLIEEPSLQFYVPLSQGTLPYRALFVRTTNDPERLAPAIERVLHSTAADLPYVKAFSLQGSLDPQVRPWVLASTMFGVFGSLALLVAAVGVYSVLAYSVAQRTREIGVRMALGASSFSVLRMFLSSGMRVAGAGVAIGSALALAFAGMLAPLLFDTSPRDPVVFVFVAVGMLLTALLASALPAWRAAAVDPATAIRAE